MKLKIVCNNCHMLKEHRAKGYCRNCYYSIKWRTDPVYREKENGRFRYHKYGKKYEERKRKENPTYYRDKTRKWKRQHPDYFKTYMRSYMKGYSAGIKKSKLTNRIKRLFK